MMLSAQHISYKIAKKWILKDLRFHLTSGNLVAIVGANGAGKSTLLNVLAGLQEPNIGQVQLEGENMLEIPSKMLATKRAILTQKLAVEGDFALHEVVMMGRYPHFKNQPSSRDYKIVEHQLKTAGLLESKNKSFKKLSGGEQQRGHLARVYAQLYQIGQPGVLFLDEPLNNLDVKYQHQTLEKAKAFAQEGNLAVAVIHDLNLASRYADQVIFMHQGELLGIGTPKEVVTEHHLKKAYDIDVRVDLEDGIDYPTIHFKPEPELPFSKIEQTPFSISK